MEVEFLRGAESFPWAEVVFLQVAHNFLHAAKKYFIHLRLGLFLGR